MCLASDPTQNVSGSGQAHTDTGRTDISRSTLSQGPHQARPGPLGALPHVGKVGFYAALSLSSFYAGGVTFLRGADRAKPDLHAWCALCSEDKQRLGHRTFKGHTQSQTQPNVDVASCPLGWSRTPLPFLKKEQWWWILGTFVSKDVQKIHTNIWHANKIITLPLTLDNSPTTCQVVISLKSERKLWLFSGLLR